MVEINTVVVSEKQSILSILHRKTISQDIPKNDLINISKKIVKHHRKAWTQKVAIAFGQALHKYPETEKKTKRTSKKNKK